MYHKLLLIRPNHIARTRLDMGCKYIEWKDINHLELKQKQKTEMEERLKELKKKYTSVFEDCPGKLVGMKARLDLKSNATPRFCEGKTSPIHSEA